MITVLIVLCKTDDCFLFSYYVLILFSADRKNPKCKEVACFIFWRGSVGHCKSTKKDSTWGKALMYMSVLSCLCWLATNLPKNFSFVVYFCQCYLALNLLLSSLVMLLIVAHRNMIIVIDDWVYYCVMWMLCSLVMNCHSILWFCWWLRLERWSSYQWLSLLLCYVYSADGVLFLFSYYVPD